VTDSFSRSRAPGAGADAPIGVGPSRRALLVAALRASLVCPVLAACEYIEIEDGAGGPGSGEGPFVFNTNDPRFAALGTVGGHACLAFGPLELLVVRANETEVIALERLCPHQNLPLGACGDAPQAVQWDPASEVIVCPHHASIFARDGALIAGPSPRGLTVFPVAFDPDTGTGEIDFGGAP
jgi:nitrite reductase/ring-hydroxylating ferredoxin subunit